MKFSIIEVLNDFKINYERKQESVIVTCPFHNDNNPSGSISIESGYFKCWACNVGLNFYRYLARATGQQTREIYSHLSRLYVTVTDSSLNPADVQRLHVSLFKNMRLLDELKKRFIDQEDIKQYKLGAFTTNEEDRVSIPITNALGDFVFLRLYLPGASKNKFLNHPRRKKKYGIHLFPIEQLSYDRIVLCGGELKAVAAAKILNKYEIGAVAPTCGENTWDIVLNSYFQGKIVYVLSDIDQAGIESAETRCRLLKNSVEEIYKLSLPLDIIQYPKGDVNDFLYIGGDLYDLIQKAEPWQLVTDSYQDDELPIETDLDHAVTSELINRRVSFRAVVSSVDNSPYSIPKDVKVKCPRNNTDLCPSCPVYLNCEPDNQILTVKKEQIEIMEMIGQGLYRQGPILKKAFGIPQLCQACEFKTQTTYTVEDTRVSQELDLTARVNDRNMQIAYFVGNGKKVELNESYTLTGRMYPHPSNQQAALLISEYDTTQDALSSYVAKNTEHLKIFQPKEWTVEGLQEKLDDIYTDIEANVTKILQRRALHIVVDLAYYSPLFLVFDKSIIKGWTEILIVGDSSQGKSQVVENLITHYQLGKKVDCANTTLAGMLGGVNESGKRKFITWGEIPVNDRRLVVLEELKNCPVEVIAKIRDMRSSGIAEITKIEKRRAHARTRIIALSNPRYDRPVSAYNYGVDVALELIGSLEDVRRFTMVYIVEKNEVDKDIAQRPTPIVDHKYTTELCRELVLFAWTVPKVIFENEQRVFDLTKNLCNRYTDEIPIVDRGEMRFKLARLAAALAARTFSIEGIDTLLVRECHVEYIYNFLISVYDAPAFGYKAYSDAIFAQDKLVDREEVKSRLLTRTPFPREFLENLLRTEQIDLQFVQDTLGWMQQDARELISFFIRQRALKRQGRDYRKTTEFTNLCKEILSNGYIEKGRPDYLKKEEY